MTWHTLSVLFLLTCREWKQRCFIPKLRKLTWAKGTWNHSLRSFLIRSTRSRSSQDGKRLVIINFSLLCIYTFEWKVSGGWNNYSGVRMYFPGTNIILFSLLPAGRQHSFGPDLLTNTIILCKCDTSPPTYTLCFGNQRSTSTWECRPLCFSW